MTSRKRTSASGRWVDQREMPVSHSTRAGIPNPTASTSGAAARTSSTASTKMSSVSARSPPRHVRRTLWWTTRPSSTTPPRSFVPPASIPITRRGGMAGRYTEVCDRSESGPSGVQGLPLPQATAVARHRPRRPQAQAQPRHRAGAGHRSRAQAHHPWARAQVARAGGGRLAAALARAVPGQRPAPGRRVARRRARALGRRQHARRHQHPRPRLRRTHRRVDRRELQRTLASGHDHARARRARQRAQALDPARHRGGDPRSRQPQDQRRLCPRRPGADHRDGGELPRQRPRDQPPRRGRLQGLPGVHRLPGRHHRHQQEPHLLAAVRQLLEGAELPQGRARARRHPRARLRPRPQEPVRPPRTTARGRPASRR